MKYKLLAGALAVVIVMLAAVAAAQTWRLQGERRAKRDAQNQVALLDTTRVVLQDSVSRVFERLSEQRDGNVELTGRLADIADQNNERGRALLRLRVVVDSLKNVETTGTTTARDTSDDIRGLAAVLDTNGVRVEIDADVPRPPEPASVRWSFAMRPLDILASITQTPEGMAVFRAQVNARVRVIADSLVVSAPRPELSLFQLKLPWWTNVLTGVAGFVVCLEIC